DVQRAPARHRLDRVDHEVRETCFDQLRVRLKFRVAVAVLFYAHRHSLLFGLGVDQVADLFDQRTRVDLAYFQFRRAAVAQKIADQTVEPRQLVLDRRQHVIVLGARRFFLRREHRAQVIDREVYEVERVTDLMRDARSQPSDDGGTFGPLQQFFQIAFAAQPRKHFVERLRQRPHFLRPRNRRAEVQIALRHFFGDLPPFTYRPAPASRNTPDVPPL